jgi:hypothetical protein
VATLFVSVIKDLIVLVVFKTDTPLYVKIAGMKLLSVSNVENLLIAKDARPANAMLLFALAAAVLFAVTVL